jgi:ATP-dependent protease HslVU (ClpYQ) peptidase subunit
MSWVNEMTVIAALSFNGDISIGSNTGYTLAHDSVMDNGVAPWVLFQDWALGFTGSMLALNVCRSGLESLTDKLTTEGDVITEVGKILTEYDIGTKNSGDPTWSYGVWCILAHNSGKIWDLDESLSLGPIPANKLWARGSGEKYALGAAHALISSGSCPISSRISYF